MLIASAAFPGAARAEEGGAGVSAARPQRESDLIALIDDARKLLRTGRSATPAQDARMAMQIQVISYMRQSQAAQDWTGTVKTHGTTSEGDAWITIEIAEGVTISTWQSESDDLNSNTLFKPHSKLFSVAQTAKIGQPVIFSGIILKSVLGKDEQMVQTPQFIARFSALKVGQ
jgi:hypothetical protein